jgi:hypothetical protein
MCAVVDGAPVSGQRHGTRPSLAANTPWQPASGYLLLLTLTGSVQLCGMSTSLPPLCQSQPVIDQLPQMVHFMNSNI